MFPRPAHPTREAPLSEWDKWGQHWWGHCNIFMFFDRGTFWVLPLTYVYLPKSARAYLFRQSVKTYYFCSGPISVDQPHLSASSSLGRWTARPQGVGTG